MSYVDRVVEKFGGVRPMARKTVIPPSTIQSWIEAAVIPSRRHQRLLDAAREHAIQLGPQDFFEPADSGASSTEAAA